MRLIKTLLLCLLPATSLLAQTPVYDVASIPKNLLPYASAVVRSSAYDVEVKDLTTVNYHVKQVVTIFNKNGDDNAEIVVGHNKIDQIKYIKGIIYDQYGKQTSKFTESDFQDFSAGDNSALFEDFRVKHFKPAVTDYPYTIAYEYEVRSKQTLNLRDWYPAPDYGTSLESSTCTFTCKPDFKLRYKEFNYPGKVETSTSKDGLTTYRWKIENLQAIKSEPYSPDAEKYLTVVKFAPEKFSYVGHSGTFTNWNELGKWIYSDLLSTRTQLSPETIAQMHELVKGITDDKLKAKKIYEYMQQKTRYVSVQVGIGDYQPFLASDVDKLSYGDCKALVNYTQALLNAVNINSWYCIVKSGSRKKNFLIDFASMNQADHVILCIPFKNDTTWVDCTSKEDPFGYLGNFTDDREVLACTPNGGKLMHTPQYTTADNKQICHASFALDADGQLDGKLETTFEGTQYNNCESLIGASYTDQVKELKSMYGIDNMEVEKLELKQDKKQSPTTHELLTIKAHGYAANTSGKLYFYANATNRMSGSVPREVRNRTTDVYINRGYTDIDEITYTVPDGYVIDSSPIDVNLKKSFGTYAVSLQQQGNQLIYKRRLEIKDGTYSKDTYQDLVDFYQMVRETDNNNIVLAKK